MKLFVPSDVLNPHETEARIATDNIMLLLLPNAKIQDLALGEGETFCGTVWESQQNPPAELNGNNMNNKTIFICGDVSQAPPDWLEILTMMAADNVHVVKDLCTNYEDILPNATIVEIGHIPILVHGVGVLYRKLFQPGYFQKVQSEHAFQALTFSNKPGVALRTGIYLTPVEYNKDTDEKHFRLLRCSTNLAGPTADFQPTDHEIVNTLNQQSRTVFENVAPANHVLAQIYHNTTTITTDHSSNTHKKKKQRKASIKAHADKTKDMPRNGIIAFCTFYDGLGRLKSMGPFDYGHKGISGLTKLHFCLKECVKAPNSAVAVQFNVTLYPDSVFLIPLSTNRLYTHEIRPGTLDADMLPTRMGYVVRCAATEAVHKRVDDDGDDDGPETATFIKNKHGKCIPLEPLTEEGVRDLQTLYREENIRDDFIDYERHRFLFSMNAGDYAMPMTYNKDGGREEFRKIQLEEPQTIFKDLEATTRFEILGKGRQGTVLVLPNSNSDVPIVRTTTQYHSAAQTFQPLHRHLAEKIQTRAALPVPFNNALAEIYDNEYGKMGFHSDQAQDLLNGTYIALFSCYKHPNKAHNRKLVVEPKEGNPHGEKFEIELTHNSVVIFSLDTNRRFRHKIVLDYNKGPIQDQQWLGLTFRTSKTFVHYNEKAVVLANEKIPLKLLDPNDDPDRTFYRMRGCENREIDFQYPLLDYTISESDVMPPIMD